MKLSLTVNLKRIMSDVSILLVALLSVSATFSLSVATNNSYKVDGSSNAIYTIPGDASSRARGFENRNISNYDFVLGGLFTIHDNSEGTRDCAKWLARGVERAEAMLFAIDSINADNNLLPNITLGYDIRDTCLSENVGLRETLDLIIRGSDLDSQSEVESRLPTLGIVGPAASKIAIPSAGLCQLFEMPQVSYSASSPDLSDKDRYRFFLRTIPPDNFQAQTIVDLMLYFNWTLVSIVYSEDAYGTHGCNEILSLVMEHDICVEVDQGIGNDWTEIEYKDLAEQLEESSANITITFVTDAETLFSTLASSLRNITWIGTDSWSDSTTLFQVYGRFLVGFFGILPFRKHVEEFHTYFTSLTIENNQRDIWFPGYFASLADCGPSSKKCDNKTGIFHRSTYQYQQDTVVALVIDAVYTFAHALHKLLSENCDPPIEWNRTTSSCRGQTLDALDGPTLLQYMQNIQFQSLSGNQIQFDENGNVQGLYSVVNLHAIADLSKVNIQYKSEIVGTWNGTIANSSVALTLEGSALQFGLDETNHVINKTTVSRCAVCVPGQIQTPVPSSCCGTCSPCLGHNFSDDPTTFNCKTCNQSMWGNNPLMGSDGCVPIEELYLKFSNPWSICIMILSLFGIISVCTTLAIFRKHWNTPIVKALGREQMMLSFMGITICFILAFVYVAPPSPVVCIFQRCGLWISFSLVFGSILVKIIRVARIFLSKPTNNHLRFAKPRYLIIFTLLIVLGEMMILAGSIAYRHPIVNQHIRHYHNDFPTHILICATDALPFLVLQIAYLSAVIITATICGMISYKFPKNFNEAKYITYCTLTLLVIWMGFIPCYVTTVSLHIEIQNAIIGLALIMSSFAVLCCIYGPRIYVIIFVPAQNSDHYSTCHPPSVIPMEVSNTGSQADSGAVKHNYLKKDTPSSQQEFECAVPRPSSTEDERSQPLSTTLPVTEL